jgi:hypothetical protein
MGIHFLLLLITKFYIVKKIIKICSKNVARFVHSNMK